MNFHIKVIEATFEAPNSNVESVLSLYNLGPTRGILIRLLQNGHTMKLYVAKVPVADRRSQVAARDQQSLKSIILSVQKSSKETPERFLIWFEIENKRLMQTYLAT